jgi:cyclic pyranopterin monophosphate synthase
VKLTHVDELGRARMVDVSPKPESERTAVAEGAVTMSPAAFAQVESGSTAKGNVLTVAEVAGTMAAKRAS